MKTHDQILTILNTIGEAAHAFGLIDWQRAHIDTPQLAADCDAIRNHFDSLRGRLSAAARTAGHIDQILAVDPMEQEGEQAYAEGLTDKDDNPHPEGTDAQNAWRKGWKRAERADALTAKFTAFDSFNELLTAPGNFWPSIGTSKSPDRKELADMYDAAQTRRGDARRASRY